MWTLIALGVIVRVVLAFTTKGRVFDLNGWLGTQRALSADALHPYEPVNSGSVPLWPYPPGFFPVLLGVGHLADLTGLAFTSLVRLPAIACDAAIAWLVQAFLGRRGFDHRARLAAVALVALGPSFAAISGFHGQIDAAAILPAVVALIAWDRFDADWRPYLAGGLIGLAASVKTVPIIMVLALIPSARSFREAAKLTIVAVAVPALAMAPYLILDGHAARLVLRYHGAPGLGGLSLLAQPDLGPAWFGVGNARQSGFTQALFDASSAIVPATLLATGAFLLRFRATAELAAVMVWLTVYAFGVTFFMQYMVWGLPFLLMAGYIREVLVLQALLVGPIIITYAGVSQAWVADVFYVAPMLAVWAAMTGGLFMVGRRIIAANGEHDRAVTPAPSY
jgi:glycosyl transferase family 87